MFENLFDSNIRNLNKIEKKARKQMKNDYYVLVDAELLVLEGRGREEYIPYAKKLYEKSQKAHAIAKQNLERALNMR